ncbi:Hdd1-like protein [Operophtera brumata]|uniref:Hdd1-like protein n=1 Tax=Operophtera brumata TaxID=104452 RepID=A0A0L7LKS7_OPEBR|nr:Hdd1-like protein [Operophtera brumata]
MSSIAALFSLSLLFLIQNTQCNDLFLGYPDVSSKLIYSEVHQENPAIWVRSETFTVNCSRNEVINAIKILDLRRDKWGDAYLKSGGIGEKHVTIELDSPTVFRGYNFLVEVYAIEMNNFLYNHGKK